MSGPVFREFREDLISRLEADEQASEGRLIDPLAAWSTATGLQYEPPSGVDPIIRFRSSKRNLEIWAVYPSSRNGGAKLSVLPGIPTPGARLRQKVRQRIGGDGGFLHGKLDLPLGALAGLSRWDQISAMLALAIHVVGSTEVGTTS